MKGKVIFLTAACSAALALCAGAAMSQTLSTDQYNPPAEVFVLSEASVLVPETSAVRVSRPASPVVRQSARAADVYGKSRRYTIRPIWTIGVFR